MQPARHPSPRIIRTFGNLTVDDIALNACAALIFAAFWILSYKSEKLSLLAVGIVAQQLLLTSFLYWYPTRVGIVVWVDRAPVEIMWALSFVSPLVFIRPLSASLFVRGWSKGGWLYVAAAFVWVNIYWYVGEHYGWPVNSEWARAHDHLGH